MSKKRRDNKGRILRKGESQEKDGRYVYKYSDLFGRRKTVRSWKLTETDPTPMGKRPELSLREQEKRIQAELSKGVCNDNMTVIELVDKYESTLKGLKETTKSVHMTVHNTLAEEEFSKKQISNIIPTSCFTIRMACRKWHCIGRSILSLLSRSTTK